MKVINKTVQECSAVTVQCVSGYMRRIYLVVVSLRICYLHSCIFASRTVNLICTILWKRPIPNNNKYGQIKHVNMLSVMIWPYVLRLCMITSQKRYIFGKMECVSRECRSIQSFSATLNNTQHLLPHVHDWTRSHRFHWASLHLLTLEQSPFILIDLK